MFYVREQSLNTDTPVYQSLDSNGLFLPEREIAHRVASHGMDQRVLIDWALSMMNPDKVFVDIGANVGAWTLPFATKAKHVFSFESDPRTYNILCANIALRNLDEKVNPFRTDLGNTLDSFKIQNIGIIRIDVGGAERTVFEGMRKTLATNKFPPVFFTSRKADQTRIELFDVIESFGYRIIPIQGYPEQFIAEGVGVPTYWNGHYSKCAIGGPIDKFVKEHYPGIHIIASDGIGGGNTPPEHYPNTKYVGALCTRIPKDNLVLLPLDDKTFDHGLFQGVEIPSWESRKSIVFWRGGASGHENPCIRERVVKHLCGFPNTDVKLTKWWDWEKGKDLKEEHFGNRCSIFDHLHYKYLPIIDGNCIASNHQWVFGSGAVPLLISHPDNDFWFKRYIEPMVHYIPIQYDLSNLKDMVEWLVTHDEAAKQIATNALELSRRIFSPEFQRHHLLSVKNTATISE